MAVTFDQKFAIFIITNFHGLQNLQKTINGKLLFWTYDDIFLLTFLVPKAGGFLPVKVSNFL